MPQGVSRNLLAYGNLPKDLPGERLHELAFDLMMVTHQLARTYNETGVVIGALTCVQFDVPFEQVYASFVYREGACTPPEYDFLQEFLQAHFPVVCSYLRDATNYSRYVAVVRGELSAVAAVPCPYANPVYRALGGLWYDNKLMHAHHPNLYNEQGELVSGMHQRPNAFVENSIRRASAQRRSAKLHALLGE